MVYDIIRKEKTMNIDRTKSQNEYVKQLFDLQQQLIKYEKIEDKEVIRKDYASRNLSENDLEGEIWKEYPLNPKYLVSNFGRIKFEGKIQPQTDQVDPITGKIKGGYLVLENKDLRQDYIYNFVAYTHLGKVEGDGYHTHHITNDGYFNTTKNLVLLTGLGEIMENSGLVPNAKAVANAAVMEYANAIIGSGELDWNNKSAWAIHLGARYDFTQSFKLGAEFFHGSKYWFAMSRPSVLDPLDFRNTKGNVYDIYAIWQIDFNQYLRFSYTHVDYHYSNSGRPIGTPIKVSDKADVFSVIYNVRF